MTRRCAGFSTDGAWDPQAIDVIRASLKELGILPHGARRQGALHRQVRAGEVLARDPLKVADFRTRSCAKPNGTEREPIQSERISLERQAMNIVGIDIGGTFTDLVGLQDGAILTAKTLTVPADPTVGRGGVARARRLRCERPGGAAARLDHRHQHRAGAQRRRHRARHHTRAFATSMRSAAATAPTPSTSIFIGRGRWCRASSPSRFASG